MQHPTLNIVSLSIDERNLIGEYEVINHTPLEIAVFDILYNGFDSSGKPIADERNVYCELLQDIIVLSRKAFPVPDAIDVEAEQVPLFQRLGSGQKLKSRFSLNLPCKDYHPYLDNEGQKGVLSVPSYFPWRLQVGFSEIDDLLRPELEEVITPEGRLGWFTGWFDISMQQIMEADGQKSIPFRRWCTNPP